MDSSLLLQIPSRNKTVQLLLGNVCQRRPVHTAIVMMAKKTVAYVPSARPKQVILDVMCPCNAWGAKKKKKKLCQHIFSELPCMKKPARIKWLFALYSKRRAVVSLCLQEPEIESLAAIESELENVAQKLHELRRGWERERETSVKKSWHGNLLFLLVLLRFTSCLVSTDRACEYVTRFNLSLSLFSRRIVPPALLPLFAPRCRSLPCDILSLT